MRVLAAALIGVVPCAAMAFEPGSLGDAYRDTGYLQGCTEAGERPACTLIAGGSQFVVPLAGPTPPDVMAKLRALLPLTYVEFRGDILNVFDSHAEFALGAVAEADPASDPQGAVLRAMQGEWVSTDDPESAVRVEGLIWSDVYAGEVVGSSVLFIGEGCSDGSPTTGTVLELFAIGSSEAGTFCYSDLSVGDGRMEMVYVARGNLLAYVAAD